MQYDVIAGVDIGNGYTKEKLKYTDENGNSTTELIDIPSVICQAGADLVKIKSRNKSDVIDLMSDLSNQAVVSIESKLVESKNRLQYFIGEQATESKKPDDFDIFDDTSKFQNSVSPFLTLSTLATGAVQSYFKTYRKIPENLELDVTMVAALPLADYKHFASEYAKMYDPDSKHVVTIRNFEKNDIRVVIRFKEVDTLAEGYAANKMLAVYGPSLMGVAVKTLRPTGIYSAEDLDAIANLKDLKNVIGIDIGDGTVNIPLIRKGKVDFDKSVTINKGIGTLLERAVKIINEKHPGRLSFKSRKELASYLVSSEKDETLQKEYKMLEEIIQQEAMGTLLQDILAEFRKLFDDYAKSIHAVFLFGGGSGPVWKQLVAELLKITNSGENGLRKIPVIYIPASDSRVLNRNGLFEDAKDLGADDEF